MEIGIGNFRLDVDLKFAKEFFKDNRGPGGMTVPVGTDVVGDPFDNRSVELFRMKKKSHDPRIVFVFGDLISGV